MEKHSRKYEQFCWVKQKNIVMEETVYHNGKRSVVCADLPQCDKNGGCRNEKLRELWTAQSSGDKAEVKSLN